MPLANCVGCNQELWWFTDTPPICRTCADNPAPIIQELREQVRLLTQRAVNGGDGLPKIDAELLECGHSVSYIVYSERRNYCGICGRDAHRKNPVFKSPRRH